MNSDTHELFRQMCSYRIAAAAATLPRVVMAKNIFFLATSTMLHVFKQSHTSELKVSHMYIMFYFPGIISSILLIHFSFGFNEQLH